VAPDHDVGGVALEIDEHGAGFRTILDQLVAIDCAMRLIGSVARLRACAAGACRDLAAAPRR
jgi:hypothetical protein